MAQRRRGPRLCLWLLLSAFVFLSAEDGVEVVHNPRRPVPPPGGPGTLTLVPDLAIGLGSGDENYMFSSLQSMQVDSQGNIYALDHKEVKVKVFDKNGKFLRSFGKSGQGPGEMQSPTRMELTRGAVPEVVIFDLDNSKFLFFKPTGRLVREVSDAKYQFMSRFKIDSKGGLYGCHLIFDRDKRDFELIKLSPDLKSGTVLARVDNPWHAEANVGNAFLPTPTFQVTVSDRLVWAIGDTDKYEFTVTDLAGRTIRKVTRDNSPARVTAAVRKKIIDDSFGSAGIPAGMKYVIPDRLPAMWNLNVDDKDRVYVRTYEYEERADGFWTGYDVFDAGGRYVARLMLPDRESLSVVRGDLLYCMVQENEEGIPQIKRYRMVWK